MSRFGGVRRSRLAALLCVAISVCAAGAIMGGSIATADEGPGPVEMTPAGALAGCPGEKFCMFYGTGASGEEFAGFACPAGSEFTVIGQEYQSARNNCPSNAGEVGWSENGSTNWKACVSAGGNARTDTGRINSYRMLGRPNC
jgi:hypothetical protein